MPQSFRRIAYLRAQKWCRSGLWNGWRLPLGLGLKFTHQRDPLIEVSNIRFVRKHTTIPVPLVLDYLPPVSDSGSSMGGLIVMEWIEGEQLSTWVLDRTTWPDDFHKYLDVLQNPEDHPGSNLEQTMTILDGFKPTIDDLDATHIMDDLRQALAELRAIHSPGDGRVCGIDGGPLIWSRCLGNREILPPVESVPAFHQILLDNVAWRTRMPRIMEIARPVLDKPHRICFTHSDLNASNILVKDGRLAGIVDWEFAGWYPEYWEYTMLRMQNLHLKPLEAFWEDVGTFNGQYEEEIAMERALWHSTGDMSIAPGVIQGDPLDEPIESN